MRTEKCYSVSCNCGVAAREGNDVIVIDLCKGATQTARFASQVIPANGTQLLRDRTGKNFVVRNAFYDICILKDKLPILRDRLLYKV